MELVKTFHRLFVYNPSTPLDLGTVTQGKMVGSLFRKSSIFVSDFPQLAMKPGGKEVKFPVFKSESVPPLGNSAFAQDHALTTASEGIANQSPFFESDSH